MLCGAPRGEQLGIELGLLLHEARQQPPLPRLRLRLKLQSEAPHKNTLACVRVALASAADCGRALWMEMDRRKMTGIRYRSDGPPLPLSLPPS